MRSFRHWSARYIAVRIAEIIYRRLHPDHPWLTRSANAILGSMLKAGDEGLEFGSGRSTIWLARRVAKLTSVEAKRHWYDLVNNWLRENRLSNVSCIFIDREKHGSREHEAEYAKVFTRFQKNRLDFILIDGPWRGRCANMAPDYLREGGILILDNCNWFIPSDSRSPGSRRWDEGPATEEWARFLSAVGGWRRIWTTSGVSDTAIYIKPARA